MGTRPKMINDKSKFLKSLGKEEFNNGLIRVVIKDKDGWIENVWAYQTQNDDKSIAILVNTPLSYFPILHWGVEIKLKRSENTIELDNEWLEEEINHLPLRNK